MAAPTRVRTAPRRPAPQRTDEERAAAARARAEKRMAAASPAKQPKTRTARQGTRPARAAQPRSGGGPLVREAVPWQSVWLSLVIALVVSTLLTSGRLVDNARSMPIGAVRSFALPIASGIDRFANFLSLNRPADAIDSMLGRSDLNSTFELPDVKHPVDAATKADDTQTLPPLRAVSAASPLLVTSIGDSMAQPIGELLADAQAKGQPYSVNYEFKISSGLARPDFYNWPARIQQLIAFPKPEALVMLFGGNDAQELTSPEGGVLARPGTAEWEATYRERVASLMEFVKADTRRIFWLLPPIMRSSDREAAAAIMRRVITEEAATRKWIVPVPTAPITSGPNETYADYVTPPSGKAIKCRQSDGVHFTIDCSRLVVASIVAKINEQWGIGASAAGVTAGVRPETSAAGSSSGSAGAGDGETPSAGENTAKSDATDGSDASGGSSTKSDTTATHSQSSGG